MITGLNWSEKHLLSNKFNIGDNVTVYGYKEIKNNITLLEFRKVDQIWNYQIGNSKWWNEESLQLIKGEF